jgi:hypothetical protein
MRIERRTLPKGMDPGLLSREEAASWCRISPCHFDKHVATAVRPINLGKRKLWSVKALQQFVDSRAGTQSDARSLDEWIGELGDVRAD